MALVERDLAAFETLADEWDVLAERAADPFLTVAWLGAWWRAFAGDEGVALTLHDDDGRLLAGGCFLRPRRRELRSMANVHSNYWDVVAVDDAARARMWDELGGLGHRRLRLDFLPSTDLVHPAIAGAGYRIAAQEIAPSPRLVLPGSLDELLAGRSRNLRSQIGRRRRALQGEGTLEMAVATSPGPELERLLEMFLKVEASGWKGVEGTAIAADPATEALYRGFAAAAAAAGWIRVYVLLLDGEPIAADYGCAFGGGGFLIKTGFDEHFGKFAPGLVLRADVIGASIEEGLGHYDFLGGPDGYKLRWTDDLAPRTTLRAFAGPMGIPAQAWWERGRPALKEARERIRRSRS